MAASIGLVFIGVGYEIFRISHQSMVVSQVVAAEQDLRVAMAVALSGGASGACGATLSNTVVDTSKWTTDNISEIRRQGQPIVTLGQKFRDILTIKKISFTTESGLLDPTTNPVAGSVVARKFNIEYARDENNTNTVWCTVNYSLDSSKNITECALLDCNPKVIYE